MTSISDLPDTDLAYFAGIFDGEGGLSLARNKSGRGRTPAANLNLKLSVVNAHRGCLDELRGHFGGTVNERKVLQKSEAHSTVFYWTVCGKKAATFLQAIQPYLRIKKRQAEACLMFAETLHPQWKEHHDNGGSLRLTQQALHLRTVAFHAFRREIESFGGRGLSWSV